MSADFQPVLLGSDINVYGMARSFHEEYGLTSLAIGKGVLGVCMNSRIVRVDTVEPNIEDDAVFVKTLTDFAARHPGKKLLVPCGDNYIKLMVRNQNAIRDLYAFACIDEELLMRLSIKESFYEVCAEHGFLFPQTDACTPEDYKTKTYSFGFPRVVKPSNSVAYWNCSFPHKKKVFVAYDQAEFDAILDAVYHSSYQDHLIIQDYIPGDDSNMRVMNCFSGKDKKVKLIVLGNTLLEEHSPEGIGSPAAIISSHDKELAERMKQFLEDIGYIGFANFDMKYDSRDGSYKLFEMNLRQGRSSFFVTAAGYNLAKWLAEDIIYDKDLLLTIGDREVLWTLIPKRLILKYVKDPALLQKVRQLAKEKKLIHSYYYKGDRSFRRYIAFKRNQMKYYQKYKRYFNNKGLRD